jgi:hypothetical protein
MRPLICIACIYAAAIFVAEITLGNEGFPLHFWHFTAIPAWPWSVPVHGAGFLWITLWSRALRNRPAPLSIAISWIFFIAAETVNRSWLKLFDYSAMPFGATASFAAVLVLYLLLCIAVVSGMVKFVFPKQGWPDQFARAIPGKQEKG